MARLLMVLLMFLPAVLYSLEWMSPEEIRPGMKGYGLSVFRGWEPERFEAEIIDVMPGSSPKDYTILARLSGAGLEKSGVIAGMSGSPVYIDGKLIGAVASTWAFSKEPICGITPIRQMVGEKENTLSGGNPGGMVPILSPVSFRGYPEMVRNWMIGSMTNHGVRWVELASGGGGATIETNLPLRGGDAVAVNLVRGDLSVQGVGTVTYVTNDEVYIFGHPMDMAGKVSLPVSRSYIYSVIPSANLSFKLGSSSLPSGAALYDGKSAVFCSTSARARMVPMEVQVLLGTNEAAYRFEVTDHPQYFPEMAAGSVISALMNHTGQMDDKRIELYYHYEVEGPFGRKTIDNKVYYGFHPSFYNVMSLLNDLRNHFGVFGDTTLGQIRLRRAAVRVKVLSGAGYYILDSFQPDRTKVYPGDTVNCKLLFRAYGGKFVSRSVAVKVPEDAAGGQMILMAGSSTFWMQELERLCPRYLQILTLEDWVSRMNSPDLMTELSVGLLAVKPGLVVEDQKFDRFPERYQPYFSQDSDRNTSSVFPEYVRETIPMDEAVFGLQKVMLNVIPRPIKKLE